MQHYDLNVLAEAVGDALHERGLMLVTAESCTGGGVAQRITAIAGSSGWFDRGFVTYTNLSKEEMLGVTHKTLVQYGAVSEEAVREMVAGALARSHGQVAVAVSGIAGPGGGSLDKPVGMVWFAWGGVAYPMLSRCVHFSGNRAEVRTQAVEVALLGIMELLTGRAR
jgi:nicotinamide-nucleotide amidase